MRIHNLIALAFFLSAFIRIIKGRITCESEEGKIGWCMNQYDPNDRLNCPLRFNDWAEPADGECPDDRVSNPLNLTTDVLLVLLLRARFPNMIKYGLLAGVV